MKLGVVLSGGGIRGVAHLGLLKALEEEDIRIHAMAGTSAGSIIALFYSSGFTTERILEIIQDIRTLRLARPALSLTGVLNMTSVKQYISEFIKQDDFKELKIPLFVAATDLARGETVYFSEGSVIDAVCASSCIPVLFDPLVLNGRLYIDGGILNNLPAEAIRSKCDLLLGCHSNPIDPNFSAKNAKDVMERALMLSITRNAHLSKDICDYILEPEGLERYKVMDLSKAKDIYQIGYQEGKKFLAKSDLPDRLSNDV
ncbi:MAG: patatin-like phospholipase family protein [Bacteroidota bacterium]